MQIKPSHAKEFHTFTFHYNITGPEKPLCYKDKLNFILYSKDKGKVHPCTGTD